MNDDIIVTVDHSLWSHSDVAFFRRQRIAVEVREPAPKSGMRAKPERAVWWISRELHQTVHSLTGIDPEESTNVHLTFPQSSIEEALKLMVSRFNKKRQSIRDMEAKMARLADGVAGILRAQN
jgi:hypothetical protein